MIFTTPQFAAFFLLFFALWFSLPRGSRKLLLLGSSYAFYGSWNAKFLLLIAASTLLDYYVGRGLTRTDDATRRKRLVTLSVVANLSALGFFKYYNFFVDSAVSGLAALGLEVSAPVLQVVLPVGISFYTFQTMSYTIDLYRRRIEASESLLDFAIYVSFFPQLVAGPIERAKHLLPQLRDLHQKHPQWSGLGLIALGAFKKAAIADNMADLVALTYTDPQDALAPAMWLGTYAFAIQIYCDFSGYSDIAVGLGRLLGLDIIQNFRAPYAAAGPSEFWRRWHISLSSWLRDYLYIPLGGNRGGWLYLRRNLLITMLLGGLWHGAAWNFVLWGAFHGFLLIVFRAKVFTALGARLAKTRWRLPTLFVRRVIFFHLVCLSWTLFRAESLTDVVTLFSAMLSPEALNFSAFAEAITRSGEGPYLALMGGIMLALLLAQNLWAVGSEQVVAWVWRLRLSVRVAFVATLIYAAAVLAPESPPPFIYFQF